MRFEKPSLFALTPPPVNTMKSKIAIGFCFFFFLATGFSQVVWNNSIENGFWSDPGNWVGGAAPDGNQTASFAGTPAGNQTLVDGVVITEVGALSFNLTTNGFTIDPLVGSLQVNGNITNVVPGGNATAGGGIPTINVPITVGANSAWNGYINFGGLVDLQQYQVDINGAAVHFNPDSQITFGIGSGTSDYGKFGGTTALGLTANATISIVINGAYAGNYGDTFHFLANGGFDPTATYVLPDPSVWLSGGLTWDVSQFLTNGTLSVIPEPTTWALMAMSLAAAGLFGSRLRRLNRLAAAKKLKSRG
ncbi:MAG: PEP-CTERM sorting domain-containing protein [Verrucomicrobiae bacterium]